MNTDIEDTEDVELDLEQDQDSSSDVQNPGKDQGGSVPPSDDLRNIVADLARNVQTITKPQPPQKRELTPEERQKYWGVWNPTAQDQEYYHKFFGFDAETDPKILQQRQAAFAQMQEGIVKQAVITARNLVREELDALRGEFGQVQEYISTEKAEKTRNRFFTAYPGLADPKFGKLVGVLSKSLADQEFDNESSFFKALAEGAAEHIRGFDPAFDLGAKTKPETAGTTLRLPRTRAGGTGGAGGGGQPTTKGPRNDADSIFED